MKSTFIARLPLLMILLVGVFFRLYGINWDNGFHFHPDERMLVMVADRIRLFSQLNPDFFNYGSLPIYILRGVSQLLEIGGKPGSIANYDGMLIVGRMLSVMNDMLVIVLVYLITYLLFKRKKTSLFAAAIYAVTFFPIQNSHFFIVDTFLNLYATALLYFSLLYIKRPNIKKLVLISVLFAAAVTSKITALVFVPILLLVFLSPLLHTRNRNQIFHVVLHMIIFKVLFIISTFIFMPYAYLEWPRFIKDLTVQLTMNKDPYIFPYTLQYVGSLPYLYYIKNIALWGAGPFITGLSVVGIIEILISVDWTNFKKTFLKWDLHIYMSLIFFLFYFVYFAVAGKSAVKFMRYMLVLYPFIAVMAAVGLNATLESFHKKWRHFAFIFIGICILFWTVAFVRIYKQPNTRIRASSWIAKNIPQGATLGVEHWDDRIPIFDPGFYNYEELTLYDRPDDDMKWSVLDEKIKKTDYIVIASNRLYVPLQKLVDCKKYKACYPMTSEYYKELFSGDGYAKVAEFTSYPSLDIGPWRLEIIDDLADESFTVYDHPKIIIFKTLTYR